MNFLLHSNTCLLLHRDLSMMRTWLMDLQYMCAWLFGYNWSKYLPRPEYSFEILILNFGLNLYLIVRSWILEFVSETVGIWTSFFFSRWKNVSFRLPLIRFQYSDAFIFIEFAFHIKCMIFWIRPNLETAANAIAKVEILLAWCCKSMGSIDIFLKTDDLSDTALGGKENYKTI